MSNIGTLSISAPIYVWIILYCIGWFMTWRKATGYFAYDFASAGDKDEPDGDEYVVGAIIALLVCAVWPLWVLWWYIRKFWARHPGIHEPGKRFAVRFFTPPRAP